MSDGDCWMDLLERHIAEAPPEIDLTKLLPGDRLRIVTVNTTYDFEIKEGRKADLKCDRADRPSGLVQIQGCTFGLSSTIRPGAIFSGGNVEFLFDEGRMRHITTLIRELHWLRRQPPAA